MAYTVAKSFVDFISAITITDNAEDIAKTRRDAIFNLLKDEFHILEAFPMGSMMHGTGQKNIADVDVLVALHYGKHIEGKSPRQVLEGVRSHLSQIQCSARQEERASGNAVFRPCAE